MTSTTSAGYYCDKIPSLQSLFGRVDIKVFENRIEVEGRSYPVINDVVILLSEDKIPAQKNKSISHSPLFAGDVQFTFGSEWKTYSNILPEHHKEFQTYFDLIDLSSLKNSRVCDLGCGNGRWSYFVKDVCKELILVDFSEAIFVARENLRSNTSALFFMGDLTDLPFAPDCFDFLFCLGVLHHLPVPALDQIKKLRAFSKTHLYYLYYNLDNRPFYFRLILRFVTIARQMLCRIKSPFFRKSFSKIVAWTVYWPLVKLGWIMDPVGLGSHIPLFDGYKNMSLKRIEQDVYDRFFTRIEQRFSKAQIQTLKDHFSSIHMGDRSPYYHFSCIR